MYVHCQKFLRILAYLKYFTGLEPPVRERNKDSKVRITKVAYMSRRLAFFGENRDSKILVTPQTLENLVSQLRSRQQQVLMLWHREYLL